MLYREAGQFKTTYKADNAIFPILQDRIAIIFYLVVAFIVIPLVGSDFFLNSMMTPFLIFTLAAIGLNILVGYTGQISLGSGAFMGIGAYSCYKLVTIFPDANVILLIVLSGSFSAIVGVIFGLPSLRIKGFYLVVTTLAAQFFFEWVFINVPWLYNYNNSGAIEVPQREVMNIIITGPRAEAHTQYLVVLGIVVLMTWVASNIIHGRIGRSWMMIRDMDIAAELMGVRPLYAKLSAFAVSSFYIGVSGAMLVFMWLGAAEAEPFDVNQSFLILFMIIIGGLGSLVGAYFGAAFIFMLPIVMRAAPNFFGIKVNVTTVEHVTLMIYGVLIMFFLIKEPFGLARIFALVKQKLRVWPFPY